MTLKEFSVDICYGKYTLSAFWEGFQLQSFELHILSVLENLLRLGTQLRNPNFTHRTKREERERGSEGVGLMGKMSYTYLSYTQCLLVMPHLTKFDESD